MESVKQISYIREQQIVKYCHTPLQAFFEFCEPAGPEEANTIGITVSPGMSPGEVLQRILQGNSQEGEKTHL